MKKKVNFLVQFGCKGSDHIFYFRPKLIMFQHNGLSKVNKNCIAPLLFDAKKHSS